MTNFLIKGVLLMCLVLPVDITGQVISDFSESQKIHGAFTAKYNCGLVDTSLCYSNKPFPTFDFAISKKWESSASVSLYQSPLLMDMDNDCIPEIVASGLEGFLNTPRITSGIIMINTATGETKFSFETPFYSWGGPTTFAIADLNADAYPEIVIAAADLPQNPENVRGRLICYDAFGNMVWISNDKYGKFTSTFGSGGAPAFADFNQDGIAEVYIYNEIFNAQTGVKLADGGFFGQGISSRSFNNFSYATSVAADLDRNPDDLELAAGYTIYQITITNTEGTDGNLMVARPLLIDNQFKDGHTSVADINLDGQLDVIVASQGNQNTSRLYVYYLLNDAPVFLAQTTLPTTGVGCCSDACSIAFVGDVRGTGSPVIGVTRAFLLLTYQYDGTPTLKEYWRLTTNDESGSTGMTMFDFNQDGVQEIVYRDENQLRIINGAVRPPINLASFACSSGTGAEYPIVGDINYSGESFICVPCSAGNSRTTGKIHVFGAPSAQQAWAPSRGIWNQYAYHVFNINDDLTVPVKNRNNAIYADKRFNNFLVQASLLDSSGNFLQTSIDITGNVLCTYYDELSGVYSVSYEILNAPQASAAVTQPVQVFFYQGNPVLEGKLLASYTISQSIPPGRKISPVEFSFSGPFSDSLYIVLNTRNTSNGGFEYVEGECDYQNNILVVDEILTVKTYQFQICEGDSLFFDGNWYKNAGIYNLVKSAVSGCDSIIRLSMHVAGVHDSLIIIESCTGDSVFVQESWIHRDTIIVANLVTLLGCDSVIRYDVRFFTPDFAEEQISACEGDSLFINNAWYYKNALVLDTIVSLPCPTFVTIKADFFPEYRFEERFTLCPEDTINIRGISYIHGGEYTIAYKTAKGCDSIFFLTIEEFSSPELPVFEPDCIERNYTAVLNPTPGWIHRWDDGSSSLYRTTRDSFPGFIEYDSDSLGCKLKYSYFLEIIPDTNPRLTFSDTIVYPGKPIHIDLGLDSSKWNVSWYPAGNLSCDTCINVILTPLNDMDIFVNLYHISGCIYESLLKIIVDETIDILIPNVFSPDLSPPDNQWRWLIPDCFTVRSLQVFDRWGNLVYFQSNAFGIDWDGSFNGKLLEAGVYTFLTMYERPDGSIVNKTGDVTILRL